MSGGAGSRAAWLGQAVGRRAAVASGLTLAMGTGAAVTLLADARHVLALALPATVVAAVAAVLWRAAARRVPHTGAGWGTCPACGTRAGTEAGLAKALAADRGTTASLAVVGLWRFSCQQGLRRALQCELLAALQTAGGRGAVAGGARLYVLPGDRVALVSPRPAEDLRPQLQALADRANRSLQGGFVAVGLVACGRAGLPGAFERADAAMRRSAAGGTAAVATARATAPGQPPSGAGNPAAGPPAVTQAATEAVRALLAGTGAIAVAYQPILELASGRVLGYEALMRPRAPVGGAQARGTPDRGGTLDSPTVAFDVAARVGLVAALDLACRDAVLADAPGLDMRRGELLFVNVAPGALVHPDLRPDELVTAVEAAGLSPQQVVFEVREDHGVEVDELAAQANRLRSSGFRLALDDTGSGQSRLETLWRCPVDYLKLDEALTQQAAHDPVARAVFHALCAFARQVGATLVVEGVENERLLRFVRAVDGRQLEPIAVQAAQGYHLGKPGPRPQPPGDAAGEVSPAAAGEPASSAGPA